MRETGVIEGRFQLLGEVGTGGMGHVYRARDLQTGVDVAVKILRRDIEIDAERFVREGRLLASLAHPAIVSYVQHGRTDDDSLYIAMEWIDGQTLAYQLERVGLDVAESVLVATQAARALAEAHRRGILHRDLKPSNLMLVGGDVGKLKLIDLGVARRFDEAGALTRTGTAMGTPGYMAPEQARGFKDLEASADIFALGCILYECLAGYPAFTGENPLAVMAKVVLVDPLPVSAACPEAPVALEVILGAMLCKDPSARPAGADAVADALERLGALPHGKRRPVTVLTDAATVAEPTVETRVAFTVLAAPGLDEAGVPTPPSPDTILRVRAALARLSANVEALLDGTVVATVVDAVAGDGAVRAARVALLLHDALQGSEVVVSAGRDPGRSSLAQAIDMGARTLSTAALEGIFASLSDDAASGGVRIDEQVARLLPAGFVLERKKNTCWLKGEAA